MNEYYYSVVESQKLQEHLTAEIIKPTTVSHMIRTGVKTVCDCVIGAWLAVVICRADVSQCQSAKTSQSLRNENDLKPTPHDLENIFDTDEEIETGDSVSILRLLGFPRHLESSRIVFVKFPGPGKSRNMSLVLESPGNLSARFWNCVCKISRTWKVLEI